MLRGGSYKQPFYNTSVKYGHTLPLILAGMQARNWLVVVTCIEPIDPTTFFPERSDKFALTFSHTLPVRQETH